MEQDIIKNFEKDKSFMTLSTPKNYEPLTEQRIIMPDGPLLAVVVGESGIGKTTEICVYARTLRKECKPVIYVNMSKDLDKNASFSFENFLQETFGTNDKKSIVKVIYENYTEKNIVPTLIIDNIHRCLNSDGKIHEKLLDFLNTTCFQQLRMAIIMAASINSAAYEIEKSILL